MFTLRGLWSRHRRKVFVALGVLGSGYALYKLYDAHSQRASDLEQQLEGKCEFDELIMVKLPTHFENIQRISDKTILPSAMNCLRSRIFEELELSHLMEKLVQGKGLSGALTSKKKLELWERLKVLSFTRTISSLWAMTMLCLYVRVQVNILGRHLYLETASGLGSSSWSLDEDDLLNRHCQQDFLATADYLSTYGVSTLILNMQQAAVEVLKEKQLKDPLSMVQLH